VEFNNYISILHPATVSPYQPVTRSKPPLRHESYRSTLGGSDAVVTKESEAEREKDKGKSKENGSRQQNFPLLLEMRARTHLLSYATFRDEDLHTTMPISAPHSIEAYAPEIPTAGPSSGVNHYGGYRCRGRGHLLVWVCSFCHNYNHNYNCNHSPQIWTMGNDTS
jgi:hypothetical protein